MEASDVGDGRTGKPSSCRKRKMPVPEIGGALTTEYQEEPTPSPSGDHPGNFASRDASPSRKRPRPVDECLIHPPDGSEPIDLNKEAEAILAAFEESLSRDVAFELHREMHTGIVTNERLWVEQLHPPPDPKPGGDVYGRIPPKEPSSNITCPSCGRAVGASRFAPHLDKCVLGPSRVRSSRSARSSPTPAEQFKSLGKPLPAIKPAAPKLAANKPSPSHKPSPSNPPKTASTKPPPRATSRPSTKPIAAKPLPTAPGASPPPPPPTVHPPIVDKEREPLHILIKLVDGSPVQTYHRVVLTSPRTSKTLTSKSPPRRSSDALIDRTYARDDDHRSSVPVGRTVNHKKMKGLVVPRGTSAENETGHGPGHGSNKGRGSTGSKVVNLGPQQQSRGRSHTYSSSSSSSSGRSSSVSRASSPVAARVPPPMFIPASRGSPPPSRQSAPSGSKQKSGSGSGGCNSSNSRYPVMT